MMKIHLKKTDGFQIDVDVDEDTTIEELKNIISNKFQLNKIHIILIYKGEKLLDHVTLQLAGINNGDSVFFVFTKKNYNFGQPNSLNFCQNNLNNQKTISKNASGLKQETNEYFQNRHIQTKQQLESLDSKFLKVESSRKATMILHKTYYQNIEQYEMYEQATERKFKTIIPQKADSISEAPLPSFNSQELPLKSLTKRRNKFVRKPFHPVPPKEERDENSSSFKVPL